MRDYDFLVIGGGIAGLTFALEAASHGRVAVLTKRDLSDSNTDWAQGGVAAVWDPDDSTDSHARDTMAAGAGLCSEDVVARVVEEGPERIRELIARGVRFSENDAGDGPAGYELGLEGGHSHRRILHAADRTGAEIVRGLSAAVADCENVDLYEDHFAIDLLIDEKFG